MMQFKQFFYNKLLKKSYYINEDTLKEFKVLVVKRGVEDFEKKFYELFPKHKDENLSYLLIFFFLMLNWGKIKQIKEIHQYLQNNKLFLKQEGRKYFDDEHQSLVYYFNKMFIQYINNYTRDIQVVFVLKEQKIKPSNYANQILKGKIGYECLHFLLQKISKSLLFLYVIMKLLNTEKELAIYQYILETLSNQMFVEYNFVKDCYRVIIEDFELNINQELSVEFLHFYEDYAWKFKKLDEYYYKFSQYYQSKFIKMSTLYAVDNDLRKILDQKIYERKDEIKQRRNYINELSQDALSLKTQQSLENLQEEHMEQIDEKLLFSEHTILHKLGDDQKPQGTFQRTENKNLISSRPKEDVIDIEQQYYKKEKNIHQIQDQTLEKNISEDLKNNKESNKTSSDDFQNVQDEVDQPLDNQNIKEQDNQENEQIKQNEKLSLNNENLSLSKEDKQELVQDDFEEIKNDDLENSFSKEDLKMKQEYEDQDYKYSLEDPVLKQAKEELDENKNQKIQLVLYFKFQRLQFK